MYNISYGVSGFDIMASGVDQEEKELQVILQLLCRFLPFSSQRPMAGRSREGRGPIVLDAYSWRTVESSNRGLRVKLAVRRIPCGSAQGGFFAPYANALDWPKAVSNVAFVSKVHANALDWPSAVSSAAFVSKVHENALDWPIAVNCRIQCFNFLSTLVDRPSPGSWTYNLGLCVVLRRVAFIS